MINTAIMLATYGASCSLPAPANDNNTHPCWRKIADLMAAVEYEQARHKNDAVKEQLISAWGRVIYV